MNSSGGLWRLLGPERPLLLRALAAIVVSSLLNLSGPALAGYAIDHYLARGDFSGVLRCAGWLAAIYLLAFATQFRQTLWAGSVGQRLLRRLRALLFERLQSLPLAFFQQHQAGDLISRINNDTERLNAFFSQSLVQFLGSLVTMAGSALFLLSLHPRLGAAALLPGLVLMGFTRLLSPWVRRRNQLSLEATGALSGEVSEGLDHFQVIVAFDRRDYLRRRFAEVNQDNYAQALSAGMANALFTPIYAFCAQLSQLGVLAYGLMLVRQGQASLGLLISFMVYIQRFYDPLRQLAALWAGYQAALAGWDRIALILDDRSELPVVPDTEAKAETGAPRLELQAVDFGYAKDRLVLHQLDLRLEAGKTYALVGPTGGGKTTTASLMARLFDPVRGRVLLDGRDLRSYTPEERTGKIGFILQDPFLFQGTLADNGLDDASLEPVRERFPQGAETPVAGLSLGQRQIVAFLRAVRRQPELLILDEATANVDTVTEKILQSLLDRLPSTTTRVIIAHRLNTIEDADEIYFVNEGRAVRAGSLSQAVAMLRAGRRHT